MISCLFLVLHIHGLLANFDFLTGAQLIHEATHWRYLCIEEGGDEADDFDRILNQNITYTDDDGIDETEECDAPSVDALDEWRYNEPD